MTPRAARIIAMLIFLGGLWACWCRIAMDWDGAYQFALTLIRQEPYKYLSRFHSWIVWLPTVWASHTTANLAAIEMVFGAPYCFAPLIGFGLSCWAAWRSAPHLLLWVAMGICLAALPGQAFMINDSIFQMHLFWPVFLAGTCSMSAGKRAILGLFGFWQLSHPVGIGLCALTAIAAVDSSRRNPPERQSLVLFALWCGLLSFVGILKLYLFPDSYAASEASFSKVIYYFRAGVLGWPLLAMVCILTAAWITHRMSVPTAHLPGDAEKRVLWCLAAGALFLVIWAADPHRWRSALDYRRWLAPLTLPFLLLIWQESRKTTLLSPRSERLRGFVGVAAALIFAVVLGLQSTEWRQMSARMEAQLESDPGPVFAESSLAWASGTAMDHWGTAAMVITSQGIKPHTLQLDRDQLVTLATPEGSELVPLVPAHRVPPAPGPGGWFDFRPVLARIHASTPVLGLDNAAAPKVP